MTTAPHCRSKKHSFRGCKDPRCPEGLYLQGLMDSAVQHGELDALFDHAKQATLKPVRLRVPTGSDLRGFWELEVQDPRTGEYATTRVTPNRPALRAQAEAVDRVSMRDFEDIREFSQYVKDTYGEGVSYHIWEEEPTERAPWGVIHIGDMRVDADLRGLGISRHLKQLVCRYADQKGLFIAGTPTNSGDGTTKEGEPNHNERALAHRDRLVRAYYRNGYVDNPCWLTSYKNGDWLSKDYQVLDRVTINHFSAVGERFLAEQGQYIRFPNGEVPKGMLERGKSFDAKGYRGPKWATTQDEAYELNHASWLAMEAEVEADRAEKARKAAERKTAREAKIAA
jgi:GNAT superfamily N-acetyltransferase